MKKELQKNIEIIKKLLPNDVYVGTGTNGHFDVWLGMHGYPSAYVYEFIEADKNSIKNIDNHIKNLREAQKRYDKVNR